MRYLLAHAKPPPRVSRDRRLARSGSSRNRLHAERAHRINAAEQPRHDQLKRQQRQGPPGTSSEDFRGMRSHPRSRAPRARAVRRAVPLEQQPEPEERFDADGHPTDRVERVQPVAEQFAGSPRPNPGPRCRNAAAAASDACTTRARPSRR